jgi:hypothetical protein
VEHLWEEAQWDEHFCLSQCNEALAVCS